MAPWGLHKDFGISVKVKHFYHDAQAFASLPPEPTEGVAPRTTKQSRSTQARAEGYSQLRGGPALGGQQAAAELAGLSSHSRFPWASDLWP